MNFSKAAKKKKGEIKKRDNGWSYGTSPPLHGRNEALAKPGVV